MGATEGGTSMHNRPFAGVETSDSTQYASTRSKSMQGQKLWSRAGSTQKMTKSLGGKSTTEGRYKLCAVSSDYAPLNYMMQDMRVEIKRYKLRAPTCKSTSPRTNRSCLEGADPVR